MYRPEQLSSGDLPELRESLQRELERVGNETMVPEPSIGVLLPELHNSPIRPRDGLVVFADGIDWNPGSGKGIYAYYAGAWHFLG